jgi:hypothetical protein
MRTSIKQHGVARRIFFNKFVLWCGNIENCCKINHIFSATDPNLRPEETRPFGISSPVPKSATNLKTTEGYTRAAGFAQFR